MLKETFHLHLDLQASIYNTKSSLQPIVSPLTTRAATCRESGGRDWARLQAYYKIKDDEEEDRKNLELQMATLSCDKTIRLQMEMKTLKENEKLIEKKNLRKMEDRSFEEYQRLLKEEE